MSQVPNMRGPMGPKTKRGRNLDHMARVAALPCVICGYWPVQVHHCIHDRFSQRRASDEETIPLCAACHESLHAGKESWRAAHGADSDYLPRVRKMLEGKGK